MSEPTPVREPLQMSDRDGDELARWLADELREGNLPEGEFALAEPRGQQKKRLIPLRFGKRAA